VVEDEIEGVRVEEAAARYIRAISFDVERCIDFTGAPKGGRACCYEGVCPVARLAGNGEKVLGVSRCRPRNPRKESIADAAHGFEEDRLGGIVLNITAQPDHEVVDGPCVRVLVHPPDLFQ
jgi:hypothetical protein